MLLNQGAVQCAYAHGTSALRTHLINMNPTQTSLTWPAFRALRQRWAGRVGLVSDLACSLSKSAHSYLVMVCRAARLLEEPCCKYLG